MGGGGNLGYSEGFSRDNGPSMGTIVAYRLVGTSRWGVSRNGRLHSGYIGASYPNPKEALNYHVGMPLILNPLTMQCHTGSAMQALYLK